MQKELLQTGKTRVKGGVAARSKRGGRLDDFTITAYGQRTYREGR